MKSVWQSPQIRFYSWLLLVLLVAVFLRLHDITTVPPGLTHDEADHGLTAWRIVDEGVREIYFTIGYGREPLYDYATAGLMSFLGPTILAGRITAVYFSIIMIAGMVAWVRRAFDNQAALILAAILAAAFWPVMSGRQALRSVLLPALFALAVALFWWGLQRVDSSRKGDLPQKRRTIFLFIFAGIILGLTFYTYIPARGMWLIFPLLLGYLFLVDRDLFRRTWWQVGLMLLLMAAVAVPLLIYLANNPTAEIRIGQLAASLTAAAGGDFSLLGANSLAVLRALMSEGDPTWRYNIAGRPFMEPLTFLLFLTGLIIAIWSIIKRDGWAGGRWGRLSGPAFFLAVAWFLAGIAPAMITGVHLSMTQAIGMQPVLFLFPAISLLGLIEVPMPGGGKVSDRLLLLSALLLFAMLIASTAINYFNRWANAPEVRVQYESTMTQAMAYLNEEGDGPVSVSTITPGRYHSPALAQMLLGNEAVDLSWFDARSSLLIPGEDSGTVIIPGFTPMPEALVEYFSTAELERKLPLRRTDLDRPLTIYAVDGQTLDADWQKRLTAVDVQFQNVMQLKGYELQTPAVEPGQDALLVTYWEADKPLEEAMLFAHVLGPDGVPIAQADLLGVPGYAWQDGDRFLQLFTISVPPETAAADYPLAVGLYNQLDGQRVPLADQSMGKDIFVLDMLAVLP